MFAMSPQLPSAGQVVPQVITGSVSTLDVHADTTGPIVITSHGYGYVAWQHPVAGGRPDAVLFCVIPPGGKCKKPTFLPFPSGAQTYGITQPFPVMVVSREWSMSSARAT
jgi:hypothetical protein